MSKAEFLIIVFTFIGAFFSIVTTIEKSVINKLLKKEATSSNNAIEIQKTILIFRWRLNRLKQIGAIVENKSGKCYYDEAKYNILLKNRVIIVIVISVIVWITTIIYFN